MAYVTQSSQYRDESLDGFFSAVGGAFTKAGGFVARKVVPTAIGFVPVVGGAASAAYSQIPGIRPRPPQLVRPALRAPWSRPIAPVPTAPQVPWWRRAIEAAAQDAEIRRRAVEATSRLPPALLTAGLARQTARAPTAVKAGLTAGALLPIVAIAALVLRRR